ncbi:exopolysaccharide production protein ExoQ [Nitrobacteraceae bacterium AZCC 1564]
MEPLTTPHASRRIDWTYSKLAELLLIGLLLVFIYPFFFAISGIDPTIPSEFQSHSKGVYFLQLAFPFLCLAIALMHRGLGLFLPREIMIYSMICLTSTIWSVNPYDTFKFAFLLFLYICSIAGICQILAIEAFCKIIVKVLAFLILASVVMAVAFPKHGIHQLGDSSEGFHVGLWRGVFIHKNLLGAAACTSVFIFLFFPRLVGTSFGFRVLCIAAATACLIFAQSAGSWVAICALLVFYCLIRVVPVVGSVLVLIVFGLSGLAFAAFSLFSEDLVAVVGRDTTFTGRTYIWPVALDAVWQKPLLGFGAYAGTADLMRPLLVGWIGSADAHNGYLDVLLGTGIVGLGSLLVCISLVLARGIGRVKMSASLERDCFMLLLIFPIASLFFSFFEAFPISGAQSVLGALTFLSLTAIPLYLRYDHNDDQLRPT